MNISITSATLNDVIAITALTHELGYAANETKTQEWLTYILNSATHAVLIAVSGEALCGWIVVEKRISLEAGFKAEITGLVVSTQHRRAGVGNKLVQAAQVWATDLGLTRLAVHSNTTRDASHSFYQSLGFALKKTSHNYEKTI
ncbi:GNAT family N-acetyltransferase [Neptunomonas japonica]|uniref:GNAT family acetyltransferase n=1 Tax=Neptunomonas japonica JAMM 1380 TaxID=1441457 RepID=A0A7R6SVJ8_9GAMM|nr:GNAT family N-acetyltransferase [Neptunomonas japonica]BBB29500.1 GNAT family acetyltransferase [Neptunomonas japonica JAMM 1380]